MSQIYFQKKSKECDFVRPKLKRKKLDLFVPVFIVLFFPLLYLYQRYLKRKKQIYLGKIESDIGSAIVSTNLIAKIYDIEKIKPIVIAKYPEIFLNNPKCEVVDFNKLNFFEKTYWILLFRSTLRLSNLRNIICDSYNFEEEAFLNQEKIGLWAEQAKRTPYFNLLKENLPKIEIYFSDSELKEFNEKYKIKNYYLILSEVINGMTTKNWGFENTQKLVNNMQKIDWVQVGTLKERKLENTKLDLRGKTNLRELFYLVKNCKAIVCTEGMYTHLSNAFNKKCFTIFSGYHPVEISKYSNVIPITRNPQMPCAYCWLYVCPFYNTPKCMSDITIEQVIAVINHN